MKDKLTEYLKRAKIKAIGFDYTDEEECLKVVKEDGDLIQYIDNPSEAVQLASVREHGSNINYVKKPTERVQLEVIRSNTVFVPIRAVKRLIKTPRPSVTAKPLIGPVPNWNRTTDVISVVT